MNSLRFRIPLMVLLGVIPPMLGAIFFASYRADVKLRQDAQRTMMSKAEMLANTVSWWDKMNVSTLKQLSQQPDIVSMDGERQKPVLKNLVKTNENLYLASTIGLNGFNVARSDGDTILYYGDRPWFLGAKAGKDVTYQSLISRTIMKPAICMATSIGQTPSEVAGIAMLCTELSALANQIGQLEFGETGSALLVDQNGKVLAHPNSAFLSGNKLEDLSQYPPIINILEGRSGNFSFRDKQGIDWISYSITLDNGWSVTILQQKAEFIANQTEFQSLVSLVAVVAVIAVSFLTFLVANYLIAPISQLTTAAEEIAEGKLDRKVEIKRKDELGSLAKSFNQMANHLTNSLEELEDRVKERTSELKAAKEAAELANQTKDRFLARISHELRSPLNSVINYATILQGKPRHLMPYQLRGLKVIRESGIHLLNLIEDILDFSKVQVNSIELNPTYLDWQSFLDGIVGMVEVYVQEKQVSFKCETVGELATGVWADEKRLRQILINLLTNAIKFTQKGKVTLRITLLESTEKAVPTELFSQETLRFEVIDTGIGISPENLDKIFQPFEQASTYDKKAEGIGLGLAISKQIVETMGSELKVKSQLNQGSTFWFEISLPVAEISPKVAKNGAALALNSDSKRQKILVVDDQQENYLSLLPMLKSLDFEVWGVDNGQQALEIAPSVQPDVILLDLFMPVKTGFTFVRQLRQTPKFKTIPIILISSSSSDVVEKASEHLRCEAFLTKPIKKEELLAVLEKFVTLPKQGNKIS